MCSCLEEEYSRWENSNCNAFKVGMMRQKYTNGWVFIAFLLPMTDKKLFKVKSTWFNLGANSPFCLFNLFSPP